MITLGLKQKTRLQELKDELIYIIDPLIENKPFAQDLRKEITSRINNLIQLGIAEGYLSKKCKI